jgi:hypothetical protein
MSVQVLFLSSNAGAKPDWQVLRDVPSDKIPKSRSLRWLEVDREYTNLQEALGYPGLQGNTVLQTLPDVKWTEVDKVLLHVKERVVLHFSGHGDPSGKLFMKKQDGTALAVPPTSLIGVVSKFRDRIPLVVLNACYSTQLAQALIDSIDVVVGMTHAVEDRAAILFSEMFYRNLIYGGQTIGDAFAIAKRGVADEFGNPSNEPALLSREAVDPSKMVLFEPLRDDQAPPPHHVRTIISDTKRRLQDRVDSLRFEIEQLADNQKPTSENISKCQQQLMLARKELDGTMTGLCLAQVCLPSAAWTGSELQDIARVVEQNSQSVKNWMSQLQGLRTPEEGSSSSARIFVQRV